MVSRGEELLAALPVSELACIEEPALLEAELAGKANTSAVQRQLSEKPDALRVVAALGRAKRERTSRGCGARSTG